MTAAPVDGWEPGTWRRWVYGPAAATGAVVVCPRCGRGMSVGGGAPFGSCHAIDAAGAVSPSVVCPHQGCAWHVFARLAGWATATLMRGPVLS